MAFLARAKKCDLLILVEELELNVPLNPKIAQLCKLITSADGYDEEFTKNLLSSIMAQREEKIEHDERIERERIEREFILKKLEIEASIKQNSLPEGTNKFKTSDLLTLISRYDGNGDISIYLKLFEKQINRFEVPKENWVMHLLGLLPLEIVNVIAREPDSETSDYEYVKKLLLSRFKLSPEQFRQKFVLHKKEAASSWRDFGFELNSFFDEWITGLEVCTYEDLKELMVTDQLKRKIPNEIREHFIDELPKITKLNTLVKKLDEYEAARFNLKKNFNRDVKIEDTKNTIKISDRNKIQLPIHSQTSNNVPLKCFNCNEFGHKSNECVHKNNGLRCFKCGSFGHKINFCPLKEVNEATVKSPHIPTKISKTIEVKGKQICALWDTGCDVTIVNFDLYTEIGSPELHVNNTALTGIDGNEVIPEGYFTSEILIDNCSISTDIYVLKNMHNDFIIGIDVINKLNLTITGNGIYVLGKRETTQVNYAQIVNRKHKQISRNNDSLTWGRQNYFNDAGNIISDMKTNKQNDAQNERYIKSVTADDDRRTANNLVSTNCFFAQLSENVNSDRVVKNYKNRRRDYNSDMRKSGRSVKNKVFVNNIPFECSWMELKDLFREKVGDVVFVKLFEDDNGKFKGCGIVEFKDNETAQKAVEIMHKHEIRGRSLNVKMDTGGMFRRRTSTRVSERKFVQPNDRFGSDFRSEPPFNTYGLNPELLKLLGICKGLEGLKSSSAAANHMEHWTV